MTYFYVVPGTVNESGMKRPDVPDDMSWVGVQHTDGTYLIRTDRLLPAGHSGQERKPIAELDIECGKRGLATSDVMNVWTIAQ